MHKVSSTPQQSVFLMSQYFAREIVGSSSKLPQNAGSIVNIASILGKVGNKYQCNYSASKGGVIAFTKSIAKELAEYNIRFVTHLSILISDSSNPPNFLSKTTPSTNEISSNHHNLLFQPQSTVLHPCSTTHFSIISEQTLCCQAS